MMTFRKLAAAAAGRLIRAYFTENKPEAGPEAQPVSGLNRAGFAGGSKP